MITLRFLRAAPKWGFEYPKNINRILLRPNSSNHINRKLILGQNTFSRQLSVSNVVFKQIENPKSAAENVAGGDEKEKVEFTPDESDKKLGLVARFKKMYKEYWYVLLPVHIVTSAGWLGGFYYASKSGVDVIAIMNSLGFSEKITGPFKDSSLGHIAVAYLLYKVATPARYTVTLGGTTLSIKYLVAWGLIRPVNQTKLMQMYQDKKDNFQENLKGKTIELQENFRDRKIELQERVHDKKLEIQEIVKDKKLELKGIVQDKRNELQEIVMDKKMELEGIVKEKKTEFEEKRQALSEKGTNLMDKDNVKN